MVPVLALFVRHLRILQLGVDLSRALGLRVEAARLALTFCGVAMTAVVVSVVGPLGFVDFIAPNIARRLARTDDPSFLPIAAVTGALLVLAGEWLGQNAFGSVKLGAGTVMAFLGGPYFLYLLIRTAAR
jgi:ABC-type Fe3+-siderophore transport system permease subunit